MTRGRALPFLLPVSIVGLFLLAPGCSPNTPDTSPAVRIESPKANQSLPAGMPIKVTFSIGGSDVDPATMKSIPFTLDPLGNGTKKIGSGQVVAFFDGQTTVGRDANPTDLSLTLPDSNVTSETAAQLITPGQKLLSLYLQYGDGSFVTPQRHSEEMVIIE